MFLVSFDFGHNIGSPPTSHRQVGQELPGLYLPSDVVIYMHLEDGSVLCALKIVSEVAKVRIVHVHCGFQRCFTTEHKHYSCKI